MLIVVDASSSSILNDVDAPSSSMLIVVDAPSSSMLKDVDAPSSVVTAGAGGDLPPTAFPGRTASALLSSPIGGRFVLPLREQLARRLALLRTYLKQ